MKFDYKLFEKHCKVFKRKIEDEQPEVTVTWDHIAKAMGTSGMTLFRTRKGKTKPDYITLNKMATTIGHTPEEYWINESES